jgi:hypothetical protein
MEMKTKAECIGTMCLTTKEGEQIPIMELHSKLEWKPVVAEPEMSHIMSGERGQLFMIQNSGHQKNIQKLQRKQKFQLLWLAIKGLFFSSYT